MKKFIIILLLSIYYLSCFSQYRLDRKWLLGYQGNAVNPPHIIDFTFNQDSFDMSMVDMPISYCRTAVTISNPNTGEMEFTTNGFVVIDKSNDTMQNGAGLSPCQYQNDFIDAGNTAPQGLLAIPYPNTQNKYILFHGPTIVNSLAYNYRLQHSIIDMAENNGLGKVVQKNISIISDTLHQGMITAVKHANGRDWWIIVPRLFSDAYYKVLLTDQGIVSTEHQEINNRFLPCNATNAIFSPDGTKYVKHDPYYNICQMMDFDRCNGLFSNHHVIHLDSTEVLGGGLCFSPNSRYLYLATALNMYQYDTYSSDLEASRVLIDTFDHFSSPFPTAFHLAQLAPNRKIYWSSTNGTDVLHVINRPDSAGKACDFRQHGIALPVYISFGVPHYPNYYLGAMVGSGCDTITTATSKPTEIANIYAYPNPTKDKVFIGGNHLGNRAILLLVNSLGQETYHQTWENTQVETSISMAAFPQGIYYLRVLAEDKSFTQKIIKE